MKNLYFKSQRVIGIFVLITLAVLTISKANAQQTGATSTHFITVWQGENGQNHMNFIVISALLEDVQLKAGDEIAVFSGSSCVGAKKLSEPINPADNTTFLTIAASQNDGSGNGFVDNDTIVFKYWDNANQREMTIQELTYQNDESTWSINGKFSAGSTAVVELVSYVVNTQTIQLIKGYNLVSANVNPNDPNLVSVTQAIRDQGSLVKVQDEAGNSYENWGTFGGWINNVGSIQKTEGYKIKVASDCSLQITGRPVVLPLDIPLQAGWNIISFPQTAEVNALSMVQSLIDQNVLAKVQDETGLSIEDWGVFGGWKNNIGNFVPGKAYKLKMNANATLTIQASGLKSAVSIQSTEKTTYFSSAIEGNGVDQMNINLVDLRESGLSAGDELAAFDGDICVGALKLTEDMLSEGTACLVASASADEKETGFVAGDKIKIYAWNQLSGSESEMQTEALSGQLIYSQSESVFVKLKSATTATPSSLVQMKIDIYPNPTAGNLTVRFSEIPESDGKIEIMDMAGRRITTRKITRFSEMFDLSDQPAGIYLLKTIIGTEESQHKLIIAK